MVKISIWCFDIDPTFRCGRKYSFRIGQLNELRAGFGFINIAGNKVINFVVFVSDLKNSIFNMQFLKLALFGAGNVQPEISGVVLEIREKKQ